MSTLAQRFAKLAASHPEIRQVDLVKACSVKAASVSDWFSGKTKKLKFDTAMRAASLYGVNPHWLATGEGAMEPSGSVIDGKVVVGFPPSNQHVVNDHQATYAINNVASIGQTLERLGALLEKADDKTRQDVAALLLRYAQDPAQGKRLAQAIEILLGEPPA